MSRSLYAAALPIEAVIAASPRLLLVGSMEDCAPCLLLKPAIRALAAAAGTELVVVEVALEMHESLMNRFGVSSFPTLLAFRDGSFVDRHIGYAGISDLDRFEAFLSRCYPEAKSAALSVPPAARARIAEAEAALEVITTPASEAALPQVEVANRAMEPLLAAIDADLAAGRLSKQEASQRHRDVIAAAYAPFQDKILAIRAANQEGLALYAQMTEGISESGAATHGPIVVCDIQSGVCRIG